MDRELQKAYEWAAEACLVNGVGGLAFEIQIKFNKKFKKRAGDADWIERKIRLSAYLWGFMTETEKRETVMHEACHIISREITNDFWQDGHGIYWQKAMKRCGLEPREFHDITHQYEARCGCMTHTFPEKMAKRMLWGDDFHCNKCGNRLKKLKVRDRWQGYVDPIE